jgi:hypothetical protein
MKSHSSHFDNTNNYLNGEVTIVLPGNFPIHLASPQNGGRNNDCVLRRIQSCEKCRGIQTVTSKERAGKLPEHVPRVVESGGRRLG